MKTIKFAAYLFYRYYSSGATRAIPYFSTLCAMATLIFLHLMQLLLLTNLYNTIIPSNSIHNRWERYLFWALVAIPIFLFLQLLIRESDLKKLSYSSEKIKKGNVLLIIYFIATMALLIFIAEIKGKWLVNCALHEVKGTHNICIYASLAELLAMSCGESFSSSSGLKRLWWAIVITMNF